MKLFTFPSYMATSRALIFRIVGLMRENPDKIYNIAFSGGGTPAMLYELWANEYSAITPWERIRVFFVDERCVPPTNSESNYKLIDDLLLSKVPIPREQIYRTNGEIPPAEEAKIYSQTVRHVLLSKYGCPQFDIVLLGVGGDGHTSSIFPGQENLLISSDVYAESVNTSNGQQRVALTGIPILMSKHIFFLVMGKNKAEIMKDILVEDCELPAAFVAQKGGDVEFYLDDAAAALVR